MQTRDGTCKANLQPAVSWDLQFTRRNYTPCPICRVIKPEESRRKIRGALYKQKEHCKTTAIIDRWKRHQQTRVSMQSYWQRGWPKFAADEGGLRSHSSSTLPTHASWTCSTSSCRLNFAEAKGVICSFRKPLIPFLYSSLFSPPAFHRLSFSSVLPHEVHSPTKISTTTKKSLVFVTFHCKHYTLTF